MSADVREAGDRAGEKRRPNTATTPTPFSTTSKAAAMDGGQPAGDAGRSTNSRKREGVTVIPHVSSASSSATLRAALRSQYVAAGLSLDLGAGTTPKRNATSGGSSRPSSNSADDDAVRSSAKSDRHSSDALLNQQGSRSPENGSKSNSSSSRSGLFLSARPATAPASAASPAPPSSPPPTRTGRRPSLHGVPVATHTNTNSSNSNVNSHSLSNGDGHASPSVRSLNFHTAGDVKMAPMAAASKATSAGGQQTRTVGGAAIRNKIHGNSNGRSTPSSSAAVAATAINNSSRVSNPSTPDRVNPPPTPSLLGVMKEKSDASLEAEEWEEVEEEVEEEEEEEELTKDDSSVISQSEDAEKEEADDISNSNSRVSLKTFLAAMEAAPDWLSLDAFALHVPAARSDRYADISIAPPVPQHFITTALPTGSCVPLPKQYTESGVDVLLRESLGLPATAGLELSAANSDGDALSRPHLFIRSCEGIVEETSPFSHESSNSNSSSLGVSSKRFGSDATTLSSALSSSSAGGLTGSTNSSIVDGAKLSVNGSTPVSGSSSNAVASSQASIASSSSSSVVMATVALDNPTEEEFSEDPIAYWDVRNAARAMLRADGSARDGPASSGGSSASSSTGGPPSFLGNRPLLNSSKFGVGSMGSNPFQLGGFMNRRGQAAVDEVDNDTDDGDGDGDGDGGGGGMRRDVRRRSSVQSGGSGGGGEDGPLTDAKAGGGGGGGGGLGAALGIGGNSAVLSYYSSNGSRISVMYTYSRPDGAAARQPTVGGIALGSGALIEAFLYGDMSVDAYASTLSGPRLLLGIGAVTAGPLGINGGFSGVMGMRSNGSMGSGGRANSAPFLQVPVGGLRGGNGIGGEKGQPYHRANDTYTVANRLRGCHIFYSIGHQRSVRSVVLASADESLVLSSAGDGVTLMRQLPNTRTSRPNAMPSRPLLLSAFTNSTGPLGASAFAPTAPCEALALAAVANGPRYHGVSTRVMCASMMVAEGAESALTRELSSRACAATGGGGGGGGRSAPLLLSSPTGSNPGSGNNNNTSFPALGSTASSTASGHLLSPPTPRPYYFDPFLSHFNPPDSPHGGTLGAVSGPDALLGFTNQEGLVLHTTISSDFKLAATCSSDGLLTFFELSTMRKLAACQHSKPVRCCAFSKNGKYAISGSVDGICRLWSTRRNAQNAPVSTYNGHKTCVTTVSFQTTQGDLAVSGSEDGQVDLWNAATGATVKVITHHRSSVQITTFLHYEVPPVVRLMGASRLNAVTPFEAVALSNSGRRNAAVGGGADQHLLNSPPPPPSDGLPPMSAFGGGVASIPKEVNFVLSACSSFVCLAEIKPNGKGASSSSLSPPAASNSAVDTAISIRFDMADLIARDKLSNARFPARLQTIRNHRDSLPTITCVVPAPQSLMPLCIFVCRSDCTVSLYQFEIDVSFFEKGGAVAATAAAASNTRAINAHHQQNSAGNVPVRLSHELWSDRTRSPITCGSTGPSCCVVFGDAAGNVLRLSVDMIMPRVAPLLTPSSAASVAGAANSSVGGVGGGGGGAAGDNLSDLPSSSLAMRAGGGASPSLANGSRSFEADSPGGKAILNAVLGFSNAGGGGAGGGSGGGGGKSKGEGAGTTPEANPLVPMHPGQPLRAFSSLQPPPAGPSSLAEAMAAGRATNSNRNSDKDALLGGSSGGPSVSPLSVASVATASSTSSSAFSAVLPVPNAARNTNPSPASSPPLSAYYGSSSSSSPLKRSSTDGPRATVHVNSSSSSSTTSATSQTQLHSPPHLARSSSPLVGKLASPRPAQTQQQASANVFSAAPPSVVAGGGRERQKGPVSPRGHNGGGLTFGAPSTTTITIPRSGSSSSGSDKRRKK